MVFTMGASIRVIKVIKGAYSRDEAYTLEFECEAIEAKDLLKELTSSAYGQRLIQLLNESKFLPDIPNKTEEELKAEAEDEGRRIRENNERLKEVGRKDACRRLFAELKKHYGEDFVKKFEKDMEEAAKKEASETTDTHL